MSSHTRRSESLSGLARYIGPSSPLSEPQERPWGAWQVLTEGSGYKVKMLAVAPGHRLSLQFHDERSEHWVIVGGVADCTIGDTTSRLTVGGTAHVEAGVRHRVGNSAHVPLLIVETQMGEYLGEDDITRLSDDYDR